MIRQRSLRANSLSSLFASGGVFAVTLGVPAILSRAVTVSEYAIYSTALAFLPLALLSCQSLRNCAGSALIVASQRGGGEEVWRAYRRIVFATLALVLFGGAMVVELVHAYSLAGSELNAGLLRLGVYAVLLNVTGIGLALLVTGPATAWQDFVPENLLKIVPPIVQLIFFGAIWAVSPKNALWWIFFAVAFAPWPLTFALLRRYRAAVALWFADAGKRDAPAMPTAGGSVSRFLLLSSISVGWWNVAAYFATSVTIAIVALILPSHVVTFGMAFSLVGLLSGGLVAVASPIASRAAAIPLNDKDARIAAFRRFNGLFLFYIFGVAVAVICVPVQAYELWVGPQYADQVRMTLLLLLPATLLRLQTMCFTIFVMSVGRQSTIWLSPLIEAIVATLGSFALAPALGIAGIALALVISAASRVAMTLFYDMKLNQDLFPVQWKDVFILKIP